MAFVSGQWGPDTFQDAAGNTRLIGAVVTAAGYACNVDGFGNMIVTGPPNEALTVTVVPLLGSPFTAVISVRVLVADLLAIQAAAAAAATAARVAAGLSVVAPLLTAYARVDNTAMTISGIDASTGVAYGVVTANGHFGSTTDGGATFTDLPYSHVTYFGAGSPTEIICTASFMYVVHSTGKLFRAVKGVFNAWTEISVAARPAATIGRTGTLAVSGDGAVLLWCNYNSSPATPEGAYAYRSADNGLTWVLVNNLPTAKHSHAVAFDPYAAGSAYHSVGDAGFPGIGLYRSVDSGATWALVSTPGGNRYGIDMVFPAPVAGVPDMVLLEGDGINEPHLLMHQKGQIGLQAAVWFSGVPTSAATTRGTTRAIGLTSRGDCVYMTTTESTAVGVKAGVYVAQGPLFQNAVLLQDTTGIEPVGYGRTVITNGSVVNRLITFNEPKFGKNGFPV